MEMQSILVPMPSSYSLLTGPSTGSQFTEAGSLPSIDSGEAGGGFTKKIGAIAKATISSFSSFLANYIPAFTAKRDDQPVTSDSSVTIEPEDGNLDAPLFASHQDRQALDDISEDYRGTARLESRLNAYGKRVFYLTDYTEQFGQSSPTFHKFSSIRSLEKYLLNQENDVDTWEIYDAKNDRVIYKHKTGCEIETFQDENELNAALSKETALSRRTQGMWKVCYQTNEKGKKDFYVIDHSSWFNKSYQKYAEDQDFFQDAAQKVIQNEKHASRIFLGAAVLMLGNVACVGGYALWDDLSSLFEESPTQPSSVQDEPSILTAYSLPVLAGLLSSQCPSHSASSVLLALSALTLKNKLMARAQTVPLYFSNYNVVANPLISLTTLPDVFAFSKGVNGTAIVTVGQPSVLDLSVGGSVQSLVSIGANATYLASLPCPTTAGPEIGLGSLCLGADGGIYFIGIFKYMVCQTSCPCMPTTFVGKIDENRNLLWVKNITAFGNPLQLYGGPIICTPDGGMIIPSSFSYVFALIKLDQLGNVSWTQTYNYTVGTYGSIVIDIATDGSLLMAFPSTNALLTAVKLSSQGDSVIWSTNWGKANTGSPAFSIFSMSDGGTIITGYTFQFTLGGAGYVLKLDSSGNGVFAVVLGGNTQVNTFCPLKSFQTSDGGILLIASTYSSSTSIAKLSSTGALEWGNLLPIPAGTSPCPTATILMSGSGYMDFTANDATIVLTGVTQCLGPNNVFVTRISSNGTLSNCALFQSGEPYIQTVVHATTQGPSPSISLLANGYAISDLTPLISVQSVAPTEQIQCSATIVENPPPSTLPSGPATTTTSVSFNPTQMPTMSTAVSSGPTSSTSSMTSTGKMKTPSLLLATLALASLGILDELKERIHD